MFWEVGSATPGIVERHPARSAPPGAERRPTCINWLPTRGSGEVYKLLQQGPVGAPAAVNFREVKANILHENLTDSPRFSKENVVQIADVSLKNVSLWKKSLAESGATR